MKIKQVIESVFYKNSKKQSILRIKEQSDYAKDFFSQFLKPDFHESASWAFKSSIVETNKGSTGSLKQSDTKTGTFLQLESLS